MQRPLDDLSDQAIAVYDYLAAGPDLTFDVPTIAEAVGMSAGETEDALRELEAAKRAAEAFGPKWSVLL
jgi:hypothetical protein